MNIKKLVGSTVDMMTLSFTERHLKEALEQEYGIPTPILNTVAEKSFNTYNLKAIDSFFEKSFKIGMGEWRKYRNLLKMIEHFLKFGSYDLINTIRKFTTEIRMLQNYRFIENGTDRGSTTRDSAIQICEWLSNDRELEVAREEARKTREKYQGISSESNDYKGQNYSRNYEQNSKNYEQNYSSPSYSNNFSYQNSYDSGHYNRNYDKPPEVVERNKKFAQSLFGGQAEDDYDRKEHLQHENFEEKYERKTQNSSYASSKPPDIFSVGGKNSRTELRQEPKGEVKDFSAKNYDSARTHPDIFAVSKRTEKQETREKVVHENLLDYTEHRPSEAAPKNTGYFDIFSSKPEENKFNPAAAKEKNASERYDLFDIDVKNSKPPASGLSFEEPKKNNYDIFGLSVGEKKTPGPSAFGNSEKNYVDIFAVKKTQEENKRPGDLMGNQDMLMFGHEMQADKRRDDKIDGGMKGNQDILGGFSFGASDVKQDVPSNSWDLGSLNLNIEAGKPRNMAPESQSNFKVKSNLTQTAPKPETAVKKNLSAQELEAKLFGLDI